MDILQKKEERLSQLKSLIEDLEKLKQEVDPRMYRQARKLEREIAVLRRAFGN